MLQPLVNVMAKRHSAIAIWTIPDFVFNLRIHLSYWVVQFGESSLTDVFRALYITKFSDYFIVLSGKFKNMFPFWPERV